MRHELKILPQHFTPALDEIKTAELRMNDRNFAAGDTLLLMEWNGDYTGDACERVVTHVADVGDYLPGYVLLSMTPPQPTTDTYRQIENDGWLHWNGEMALPPVKSHVLVEVKLRNGRVIQCQAKELAWRNSPVKSGTDIIAYRVIENDWREG